MQLLEKSGVMTAQLEGWCVRAVDCSRVDYQREPDDMTRMCIGSALFCCLLSSSFAYGQAESYRAAILDEPSMPVEGQATPAETFEAAWKPEGIEVVRLDAVHLADPQAFNPESFDLLVVPTGASFPVAAKGALLAFLQKGGDLLCTGGYAFDKPWVKMGEKWVSCGELAALEKARARDPRSSSVTNGGFENGTESWSSTDAALCTIAKEGALSGVSCGRVVNTDANALHCFTHVLDVAPGKSYLVGGEMKTDQIQGSGFAYMAVYQHDAQGGIITFVDFTQIRENSEWKRHEVQVNVSPQATKVLFHAGLYQATGMAWFDDITCAPVPTEDLINAHYGTPGDSLKLEPLQLTLFSPDQPIQGESLAASADSVLPERWRSPGAVSGFEATAQLRANARWVPFIEAQDQWNRSCGAAGALVHHYGGTFADSSWALFGVTNRDIFEGEEGQVLAEETLKRLRTGLFLKPIQTDFAIYRRGDTPKVTVEIRNASRFGRTVHVDVEYFSLPEGVPPSILHTEAQKVDLSAQTTKTLEFSWRLPSTPGDFVLFRVVLRQNDLVVDEAVTGFCVYDDRIVARAPSLRYKANAYTITPRDGRARRTCLFGADTYGNMFGSPTASPLSWYNDLRMMRDNGLDMFENLQFTPPEYVFSEKQQRQLDALIQLSQRFGLPYMAGLLIGQNVAVEDAELAKLAEMCRQFAAQYKDTPGLIYYLNGDFVLNLKDTPDVHRLWNDFLRKRYGTDEALQKAWAPRAPEAPIGQLPVKDYPAGKWYDVAARDVTAFRSELMKRWINALCAAVRQHDKEHPITSEYYQRPVGGIDLRLTLGDMDAANIGYFDVPGLDIARLMATIKWNDMRPYGKTVNIGEFGVKTHDAWSLERGGSGYHIQRTQSEYEQLVWWVAHAALAMGVTKIQNWCWSDDPDGVFPWGLAWNNPLRPKPALRLYRNLHVLAQHVEPTYKLAEVVMVMPDTWRQGAPEELAHDALMTAIECLLATNVPFDLANEADIVHLNEHPPRLVILPFAYALSDEALDALARVADAGCCVYLSGDPSITPNGQRDPARLEKYLGAHFKRESINALGFPFPEVTPIDAKPFEEAANRLVLQRAQGKGRLIWSPEPWESLPGKNVFVRDAALTAAPESNLYFALIEDAQVKSPVRVLETDGVWRVLVTPSGPNTLVSAFPRTLSADKGRVRIDLGGFKFEFGAAASVPATMLLSPEGDPLAVTGSQYATMDKQTIAEGDGAWMVVALDGRPISRSERLAISSTTAGKIRWTSAAGGLAARIVEWKGGALTTVANIPLRPAEGSDKRLLKQGWELDTLPNELYAIVPSVQPVPTALE